MNECSYRNTRHEFLLEGGFNWMSWNQRRSNCSGQSQRTQTIYLANQNSKPVRVADVKRGRTCANESWLVIGFTSDWMTKRREFFKPIAWRGNVKQKLVQIMNCFWHSSERPLHLDIDLFLITGSGFSVWNMRTRSLKNRSRVNKKNRYCTCNSFISLFFGCNISFCFTVEFSLLLSESTSPESSKWCQWKERPVREGKQVSKESHTTKWNSTAEKWVSNALLVQNLYQLRYFSYLPLCGCPVRTAFSSDLLRCCAWWMPQTFSLLFAWKLCWCRALSVFKR